MGITAVTVNGTALDLDGVVYEISVSHGRNDIQSAPQASDARVLLRGFSTIPAEIGDVIQIDAYSESRFTGTVTDITLTHGYSWQGQENPLLELLCTGHMAKLGYIFVGESGYTGQTLKNRVEAIMTDTGLVNYTNVAPYLEQEALANQDGGYNALTLLTDLGTQVGGTVGDFPDGTVFWESYSSRGYGYNPSTWLDVTDQWQDVPYSWADVYQSTDGFPTTVTIDNDVTIWEPVWKNNLQTVLNDVTVTYGSNSSTNSTDVDSIALYGRRSTTVATQLQHAGDADDRADEIIRAQAQPHYALQNVQILVHNLTNPKLGQVLGLLSGSRVQVNDVPPPHPLEDYLGVVEGWTEVYTPGQHILTLSLSDPRYSYAVAQWGQVSGTLTWGTTNASVQWYNVVLPSDLLAA
jgi:hypothetical protein